MKLNILNWRSSKKTRILRTIFTIVLLGFAALRVPEVSAADNYLVKGIFEIRDMADIKQWTFTLPAGYEYTLEIGYYSPGSAHLRCRVSSPEIEFYIFDQAFAQGDNPTTTKWKFATPTMGRYTFVLYLQEPVSYAITVFVHLTGGIPLDNVWTEHQLPEQIPLCTTGVYASDGVTTRQFDVKLNENTTYFFSVTAATEFDYRYTEWWCVNFDAELVSHSTGAIYLVGNDRTIFSTPLEWQSTWFGCSKNDTYTLRTIVTDPDPFRVSLGLTIAPDNIYGDVDPDRESDQEDTNSTTANTSQATNMLVMIVVGLIAIPMLASWTRNRRRRRVGTGMPLPVR